MMLLNEHNLHLSEEAMSPAVSYDHIYTMLEEIFESSILEADISDLISNLGELYDSFNGQGFEESFKRILLYILSESKRSTEVSKILRFIAESTVTLDNKYKTAAGKSDTDEDIDDIVHPLLKGLFKILISWSEASSYTVRFRSCQLLYSILTYIQDHGVGEIAMETYESISKLIESRRKDVSSNVRAHAVLLAKFFQDPSTVNDPVIAVLCWQMQHDPYPHVRQNIVSIIAACEETIIPIANRFLYDKHPGVRNAALLHICKRIGPRSFAPAQRILILHRCFTDPSDVIRRNAQQKLIPVWFRACGDKLSNFFKLLRIDHESLDNIPFIKELINIMLKCVKISQIIEEIELDMNSFLPRLPLSGERVFLWRHLFINSSKDDRLSKFIAPVDDLIPFILKCLDDSSCPEVEVCVFTELLLFLCDIMETLGIKKCDEVFPMVLNLLRHPYVPKELVPYFVTLHLTFSPKEKDHIHNDILEVLEDLQKLMQFSLDHEKNILLKCFAIVSQVLTEVTSLTPAVRNIKDKFIINYLNSVDEDIKTCAISALTSYCLLDIKEAKLSWCIFEDAIHMESGPLRNRLFEGMFDILQCHGSEVFADFSNDGQEKLELTVTNILKAFEDEDYENEVILKGILKLYMCHKISSPVILANVIMVYFHPDGLASTRNELEMFFPFFAQTKACYNCLVQSFLTLIDLLFDASKNSFLYEISIKEIALQLLVFSKTFENLNQSNEDKFQDLLALKLCKRFLKKPWRLPASDLYGVCYQIMPKQFDTLLNLKELVVKILESLQSSIFQKKNPYAKRSIKNFSSYLKKIQQALNKVPLMESKNEEIDSPIQKKLEFGDASSSQIQDDILSRNSDIEVDTSSVSGISSSDESGLRSSINPSEASTVKRPSRLTAVQISTPSVAETSNKIPDPTPRKIATGNRLSRKTPGLSAKKTVPDNSFKTPGPQKNKSRKQQLDINLTKTC
ncbi:condensin complex subunit 3 isoform X1 [Parasteatoda tepidariorum]|uniref:condensin complex subunit 3 isoform X1 n=2 Tax=Parasteatoda tepidariorum TaxID=114398 RepID=UPI001C719708|nr:uncharacterized protein LOC107449906 isoform X1 [Parasteatoda tepidariorum]